MRAKPGQIIQVQERYCVGAGDTNTPRVHTVHAGQNLNSWPDTKKGLNRETAPMQEERQ
jgi:hypothetical protein